MCAVINGLFGGCGNPKNILALFLEKYFTYFFFVFN
jgi:hypothetical protein